jgi:hypothetical protein
MKFQIKDVKKAVEFIELIKFIKTLSNHITCIFYAKRPGHAALPEKGVLHVNKCSGR